MAAGGQDLECLRELGEEPDWREWLQRFIWPRHDGFMWLHLAAA